MEDAKPDEVWGVEGTRTTPGVQRYVSYLCATLTFEDAAETFRRFIPLGMSPRQALNLMKPVGKALEEKEDGAVKALFEQALKAKTEDEQRLSKNIEKDIRQMTTHIPQFGKGLFGYSLCFMSFHMPPFTERKRAL
jgi:hypothetical protein